MEDSPFFCAQMANVRLVQRVSSEIEKEFAKYSVKMIVNSANTLIDLAAAINAAGKGDESSATFYEIATLWKRSKSYRDRVLGVYTDVLSYILNDGQQTSSGSAPDLTKFGNNRLTGDIGDLSGLTVSLLLIFSIRRLLF